MTAIDQAPVTPLGYVWGVHPDPQLVFGWERWIGDCGVALGIDKYGASAPGERVLAEYGFTSERVAEAAKKSIALASKR